MLNMCSVTTILGQSVYNDNASTKKCDLILGDGWSYFLYLEVERADSPKGNLYAME